MVGVAEGQFPRTAIYANFKKKAINPTMLRTNKIFPMGNSGMVACFLTSSTFVFGDMAAVKNALDARDGVIPNMLGNSDLMDMIGSVTSNALWSVLDQRGTQAMVETMLSEGQGAGNMSVIKKSLNGSRYGMDFNGGVSFSLDVVTADTMSAATLAALMNAALVYKQQSGTPAEKMALTSTKVTSDSGTLELRYSSSDDQFASLLKSPLFQAVVR
jgi:hypothetical protein